MTPETKKRIHLIYGIVTGAAAVLAGICLIAACCTIYYGGLAAGTNPIYSREIVAAAFAKISVPVYTCLILVMGGMVLNLFLPQEQKKLTPEKNLALILQRLQEKTDLPACDDALRGDVALQQKSRKLLRLLCAGLLAVGLVIFLGYACNGKHWGSNSTPSMISAMYMMLACLSVPLAFTIYTVYFCHKSILAEIDLMKQASAQAPKKPEPIQPKTGRPFPVQALSVIMIVAGVALVILGAANEGTRDILNKAIAICTECVGLG